MLIIQTGCGTSEKPDLPNDIKSEIRNRIEKGYHLGIVVGVIDENGSRYYGFGKVSIDDSTIPDENSIFEIGSITKTFTSTLLSDLDQKGEMKIQDSIQTILPVFNNVLSQNDRGITLENLATHTSGLPREPLNINVDDDHRYSNYSVKNLNDFLSNYILDSLSNEFSYSNLGVLVLEHAIETKMNQTYESLIIERVTTKLNMSDTNFDVPKEKKDRVVQGYNNGRKVDELNLGMFQSMGGLRSTPRDMLRYLGAQLGMYPSPLSDAIKVTQRAHFEDDRTAMGLGWEITKRKESGKTIHYHKGGTNGFVSFTGFNLQDQIGVIVLVNGKRYFSDIGFRLLDPSYSLTIVE